MAGKEASMEQVAALMLRGMIAALPQADQDKVKAAQDEIEAIVKKHDTHGAVALTLVSLDMATDVGIFDKLKTVEAKPPEAIPA